MAYVSWSHNSPMAKANADRTRLEQAAVAKVRYLEVELTKAKRMVASLESRIAQLATQLQTQVAKNTQNSNLIGQLAQKVTQLSNTINHD